MSTRCQHLVTLFSSLLAAISATVAQAASEEVTRTNAPMVITAGPEWIPLRPEMEIEPGSALDFSDLAGTGSPAGKHGLVIARPDGQFAFVDSPDQPRRFYGVNLCFSAQYLAHDEADRLAERLARLGYNAVRFHHYERELISGQTNSTTLNPQKLDQLDYLAAALIRRGLYLTTDLFVSRPVLYRETGIDREGTIPMDTFKILVPVHGGAFENWRKFSRALLGHVNPYTKRSYAGEPALAWIALINEGNFGNFFKDIRTIPEWKAAWNQWLAKRYASRGALAAAWGAELKDEEDAQSAGGGSVALPEKLQASGPRSRDCMAFLADTDRDMVQRMKAFLKDELGCRALVSNSSSWTRFTTDQSARSVYDYVDDHFYVDHPNFLEGSWRLPSRCPNTSPLSGGAPGGRSITFTRLFDKPFTVTEYNYSGPGRFRGVGGILTGALGALQGWGGIWRFAYSHSREALFTPSHMEYFNLADDPLSQAADRASLCLFLRGDLQTARHSVALVMTEADLAHPAPKIPTLAPAWHWLAWVTRVGTQVVRSPETPLPHSALVPLAWETPVSAYPSRQVLALDPYMAGNDQLITALKDRDLLPSVTPDPEHKFFRSETGEITIDGPQDRLVLDTARTAGCYAPVGQTVETTNGGVRIIVEGSDATVWVSALDRNPIRQSHRLLVTHLTDLQNTGIRYAEPARQTLLDWGRLPHLVRAGKAEVSIKLEAAARYGVWALTPGGKRLAQVPAKVEGDALCFTTDVAGDPDSGARMLYEVSYKNSSPQSASAAEENVLRAGAARIEITPTQPVTLAGYASRTNLSQGVHDPLSARVAAFAQGERKLVLVSIDNLGFYNGTAEPLRRAILKACRLEPSELFLCAIHTHSAPALALDIEKGHPNNIAYTKWLQGKLVEVVRSALDRLAPVKLGVGSGSSPVGVNRREETQDGAGKPRIVLGRNPSAMTDREVQVLKVARADSGETVAVLFAYATHSTSLGPRNYLVSGDIHGLAAQFLEKYLGTDVVTPEFAGASGNIDPWVRVLPEFRTSNGWVPEPVLMGTMLGEEVERVLEGIKDQATNGSIRTLFKTVELPGKPRGAAQALVASRPATFNITVGCIGDTAFVGLGGEVFNEFGKAIKSASPFRTTFVMTHCNGAAGYMPTRPSYEEGGYEVQSSSFAPGAGEQLVEEVTRLLRELKEAR
jgi:hypothetical protein